MAEGAGDHLSRHQKQENRIVERVIERIKELLPSADSSVSVKKEDLGKFVQFMESARILAASAILAALLGALYEYLALMGVADVSPARVVLIGAWFFSLMFSWELVSLWATAKKPKIIWSLLCSSVFAVSLLGLDHWAVNWRLKHPPEVEELRNQMQDVQATVHRLTPDKSSTQRVADNAVQIKEIKPTPGFLKMELYYPRLPIEQKNLQAVVHVYFKNYGSTYVHNAGMAAGLYYVDFKGQVPPLSIVQMRKGFIDTINKITINGDDDVGPGDAVWNTLTTSVITDDMFGDLEAGTARIYLVAKGRWTVNQAPDQVTACLWLQPVSWDQIPGEKPIDPSKYQPVWHEC